MTDDGKKKLGERIRRARMDSGITQKMLAETLGMSQGVISNVENGVSTIDAPELPTWAAALNKPIMFFFLDEPLPPEERAAAILDLLSNKQRERVLEMLEYLALGMRYKGKL